MISVCRFITVFFLLSFVFPTQILAANGALRYTIAVESFENNSNWRGQYDLGHQLDVVLTGLLHESGSFMVIGEKSVRTGALEEQDLAASSRGTKGSRTPVTGQMASAQLLVRGAITHVQHSTASDKGGFGVGRIRVGGGRQKTEINVTFYLVDTSTGLVVASKNVVGSASKRQKAISFRKGNKDANLASKRDDNMMSALQAAGKDAIDWMASELEGVPWHGSVMMIEGDQIFVDRGSQEGVSRGQVFIVGKTKVMRDPETGEVRGQFVEEVARIEVVQVQPKMGICRLRSGNLGDLRKGLNISPAR